MTTMYAIPRPGLQEFLAEMGQMYNLCIYTSGDKEVNFPFELIWHIIVNQYAGKVLKSLGIVNLFCAIYSRKYTCEITEDLHIKKLSMLGYPLETTIFIDVRITLSPEELKLIIFFARIARYKWNISQIMELLSKNSMETYQIKSYLTWYLF